MQNKLCGGKQQLSTNMENIRSKYKGYSYGKQDAQYNIFYAFLLDEVQDMQATLYNSGLKECLLNEKGIFFKKSDIFRSVCIDKLYRILSQDETLYCQTEQNIFLGVDNYHKPDISIFCDFNEDSYDDYVDDHMINPKPSILIEVIDTGDMEYLYDLIRVYRKSIMIYNDVLILFVDPIKKELYMFRNDIQIVMHEKEILFYLQKVDYFKDLQYKSLVINFETMLMKK